MPELYLINEIPLSDAPVVGNGRGDYRTAREKVRTAFGRLSYGQDKGKAAVLVYDDGNPGIQSSGVPMLNLRGEDEDACNLIITIAPPMVVPLEFARQELLSLQSDPAGSQGNFAMLARELAGKNFPGTAGPILWPQLEAIVKWGVGGTEAEARVDVANGVTMNLTASWVRVHLASSPTQRSDVGGTSAAYVVQAFVGPGYTSPGRAQKTVFVGEAPVSDGVPGESGVFAVPRFAKGARLVGIDGSSMPPLTVGTIRFWQSPDGVAGGNCVGNFFVSGNQNAPVEVPNAGLFFSVLNGQGVSGEYAVVFDLAV